MQVSVKQIKRALKTGKWSKVYSDENLKRFTKRDWNRIQKVTHMVAQTKRWFQMLREQDLQPKDPPVSRNKNRRLAAKQRALTLREVV